MSINVSEQAVQHFNLVLKSLVESTHSQAWYQMEDLFTISRRFLRERPDSWRQGPGRILSVAPRAYECYRQHTPILGKTYLDLGCGRFHPFGMATYFYLNGLEKGYCIDPAEADKPRASEALYDLLCDALARPELWKQNEVSWEEYFSRIRSFDLYALREGDLDKGLGDAPLEHHVTDAAVPGMLPEGKIDLVSSRSVLEHCLDLDSVLRQMYSIMSPGGIGFHEIDLVDHRVYSDPERYHYWSFLTEGNLGEEDKLCNLLRSCQILDIVNEIGFEVLEQSPGRVDLPAGLRAQLRPEYQQFSDEELQVIGLKIIVRKPDTARQVVGSKQDMIKSEAAAVLAQTS